MKSGIWVWAHCISSHFISTSDRLQIPMNVPWAILVEMGPARMWLEDSNVPARRDLSLVQWWHAKASAPNTEELVAITDCGNSRLTTVLNQITFIINSEQLRLTGCCIISSLCGLIFAGTIKKYRWLITEVILSISGCPLVCLHCLHVNTTLVYFLFPFFCCCFYCFQGFFPSLFVLLVETSAHGSR